MVSLKGTNQEFGRPYNRRIVLEAIRRHGPVERADIARRVGLTVQTVSNIIRELEELDLVTFSRAQPKGRGSPATSLTLNPSGAFAVGLSVTPRGIEAALVDLAGTLIAEEQLLLAQPGPEWAFTEVARLMKSFREKIPGRRLLGVGLAMPGPFDIDSMSFVGPTTLESWRGIPVEQKLAEATALPAFIESDHAAAALGECLYGAGREVRDFYYLYFGVGLGGSMVQDGLPVRGARRNAGEIGHVPMVVNGRPCSCGNRGCLERYLSLEAYARREPIIGRAAWIEEAAPLLRNAVVTIENLFDPDTIVIGGIAEDEMLQELIAAAEPLPTSVADRKGRTEPRLMRSKSGLDAVLRGAASLAFAGALSPRFGTLFAQPEGPDKDHIFARRHVA
ncbi:ROK family transcriptional regulator [Aestuariivirga sp.]|uniref:ROK family transcriptional regulator n=1 Tax=Aestuariivirga sp. TaxID=2650926 RepID=UPI003BAACE92